MAANNQKRIRVIDVAKEAGVSKATAVFSLNDRYDIVISDATRQRVKDAAEKLGYKPNPLAKALSTGKTGMINIVVPYIDDPFFSRFLAYFQQIAYDAHLTPIVTANFNEDKGAEEFMERLIHWPCDGYIVCYSKELAQFLKKKKIHQEKPIVYVGEKIDNIDPVHFDSVYTDNSSAITEILRHFEEDQRQDIVFVSDETALHYANDRYARYMKHMETIGKKPVEMIVPKRTRYDAYQTTHSYIETNKLPQAFFCYNDELALGVQSALIDAGYRIPEDTAVSGFDHLPESDFTTPRLSTAAYPYSDMCNAAWKMLTARMKDLSRPAKTKEFKSVFIPGGSSRLPDRAPTPAD